MIKLLLKNYSDKQKVLRTKCITSNLFHFVNKLLVISAVQKYIYTSKNTGIFMELLKLLSLLLLLTDFCRLKSPENIYSLWITESTYTRYPYIYQE